MGGLEKKTYHDCKIPNPVDREKEHRWTCPACKTEWHFTSVIYPGWSEFQSYGFMGRKTVEVNHPAQDAGYWSHVARTRQPLWVAAEESE